MERYEVDFIDFTLTNGAYRHKEQMNKERLIELLNDGMVTVRSVKLVRIQKKS